MFASGAKDLKTPDFSKHAEKISLLDAFFGTS
jgi:hypothetical protein